MELQTQAKISFKNENYLFDTRDSIFSASRFLRKKITLGNEKKEIILTEFYFSEFEIVRHSLRNVKMNRKLDSNQFLIILALYDYLEIDSDVGIETLISLMPSINNPIYKYIRKCKVFDCYSLRMFTEVFCVYNFVQIQVRDNLVYIFSEFDEGILSLFCDKKNENVSKRIVFNDMFCSEFARFDLVSVKRLDILIFHYEIDEVVILDYELTDKFMLNLSYLSSITKILYENYKQINFLADFYILKNIKSLAIYAYGVENNFVREIDQLNELETLKFDYKMETKSNLALLQNLKMLKCLELVNVKLSKEDLEVLYTFEDIESFRIDEDCDFHRNYSDNTFLRKIKMYHKLSKTVIYLDLANNCKKLKKLFVNRPELLPGFGKVFAEIGILEELHLSNDIEDEDLQK